MLNSYIGRLVLIYACTLILLISAVYIYYDDWLEPQVSHLESMVIPECELCSFKTQYQKQGLAELIKSLNIRKEKRGFKYAVLILGKVNAGDLQWENKNAMEQKSLVSNVTASKKSQIKTISQDFLSGVSISSIELDESHSLYIEEYIRLTSISHISDKKQKVIQEKIRGITTQMAWFGVSLIFLGFVATTIIAWKIHFKLKNINKTADYIIQHQDLTQRISHSGGNNEFDHLAINLNKMLAKIESKVEDIKQISNNIAHDLRTPLTSLHNKLEQLELDNPQVSNLTDQVNLILNTFNALLRISHLESGNANICIQEVNLTSLTTDVIDLYQPLAEEKGQLISMALESLSVKADINLLFQAIANLVENAIKYAPENSTIVVGSVEQEGHVVISIKDEGLGVPDDQLSKVVERFVRLDETRNTSGNGLGLSMVKAISEAHQGRLILENLNVGFSVSILVPS
ncbi:MAG: ATP-binding protein [Colwellia sp.]|nr:ATP-binding protein [Colwellia sp.]